jgi:ketosteroid isomerase-like protein
MAKKKPDEVLRSFYESLNQGDVEAAVDVCDPAVEVYKDPDVVAVLPPRGHAEVAQYLRSWLDTWDLFQTQPEEFIEAGDQIVSFVQLRARGKGSRFDIEEQVADVFTVKGEKIASLRLYVDRQKALEAAGVKR